jgi:hypothetical protein
MVDAVWSLLLIAVVAAVTAPAEPSVTSGVLTFGGGIIVGLVGVVIADRYTRSRIKSDYERWNEAGRPERRSSKGNRRRADDGRVSAG